MKNFILIFSLLFSFSVMANHHDEINLNGSRVHLGYLEGEMGMPFHKELIVKRTKDTPKKVTLSFFFTQIEMVCEDRVPDGGYGGYYYKSSNKYYGYHGGHNYFGGGHGHGDGHGDGYHRGPDRNFMGICRRWTEMETQKSGRVGIYFKKNMHGDEETLRIMITARDRHSTLVLFDAEMLTPSRNYKKKRINSRAIMFN